jgi:hypothetical protein
MLLCYVTYNVIINALLILNIRLLRNYIHTPEYGLLVMKKNVQGLYIVV